MSFRYETVPAAMTDDERRRKANLRLALILASVAVVCGAGFVAKIVLVGG